MLNVYCIPGLGVDERLFQHIKLNKCSIHHIKWEAIQKNETLPEYAMRLSKQIDTSQPFALIGVSFGGMCCSEIARKLNPAKTFLISSCKNSAELPKIMELEKILPIYKILTDELFIRIATAISKLFGVIKQEHKILFAEMLKGSPKAFFKRAIHCIANWNQEGTPKNTVHIHGTSDKILPYKNVSCDYTIENGTHWMIMNEAEEINEIINKELMALV